MVCHSEERSDEESVFFLPVNPVNDPNYASCGMENPPGGESPQINLKP
jgi:hypothetical protein